VLAQEEARNAGHDSIRPIHIFMGVLREEEGVGARSLLAEGFSESQIRSSYPPNDVEIPDPDTETTEQRATRLRGYGQIPFTPGAKKALENALREALSLGHNYIGTEHILLGLVRESEHDSPLFEAMGLDPYNVRLRIRDQVIKMLAGRGAPKVKSKAKDPVDPPDYLRIAATHLIQAGRAWLNALEQEINADREDHS
jgi:ATP-dependent Clp protease ATP-binding subunit ClpC